MTLPSETDSLLRKSSLEVNGGAQTNDKDSTNSGKDTGQSQRRQLSMLILVLMAQFCTLCMDTFIFPFFPEKAEQKGLTKMHIGFVYSAYELSRFLSSPIFGSMLSRFSATNICIIGTLLSGVSCVCFGLLDYLPASFFLAACIVVRMIAGNGSAMLTISATSILLKSTNYSTNTVVGAIEMVIGLGYISGPCIGALLFMIGGYQLMFWLLGGLTSVFGVIFKILLPIIGKDENQSKSFLDMMLIPGVVVMYIHCVVQKLGGSAIETILPIWTVDTFHSDPKVVGSLFALWAVVYIILCPAVSKLTDKGYVYALMTFGWIVCALVFLFISPSPIFDFIFHNSHSFALMVLLMCVYDVGQAALNIPPFQASLNLAELDGYDPNGIHTYGLITGMVNSGHSFGAMIGPAISGAMSEKLGFGWTTTILSGIHVTMAAVLGIYLLAMKMVKKPVRPTESKVIRDEEHGGDIATIIARKVYNCLKAHKRKAKKGSGLTSNDNDDG